MESEQRASFRILESDSKERDLVRQEALHLHDNDHRSEQAALLPGEEVDEFTFQFGEARQTGEYFHDVHERNLTKSHRIAAWRDRSKFEGRNTLRTYDEEENVSEAWETTIFRAEKGTKDSSSLSRLTPSPSGDTVAVLSTIPLRSHVTGNPFETMTNLGGISCWMRSHCRQTS